MIIIITVFGVGDREISGRNQFIKHLPESNGFLALNLRVRLESVEDKQKVPVTIAAVELGVDVESKVLEG